MKDLEAPTRKTFARLSLKQTIGSEYNFAKYSIATIVSGIEKKIKSIGIRNHKFQVPTAKV